MYMLLSSSVTLSMLIYAIYIANISSSPLTLWSHIGFTVLSIVAFLGVNILLVLVTMMLQGEGDINVFFPVGLLFYFFLGKYKYIYHAELGYFITSVSSTNITVYKQGIFNMKEIVFIVINERMEIEAIQDGIKKALDSYYHEKLKKVEEYNKDISTVNNVMKWDGYLDKKGKRDNKLNDIL